MSATWDGSVRGILQQFGLERFQPSVGDAMTVEDFATLEPASLRSYGVVSPTEVVRFRNAVGFARVALPPSPSTSDVLELDDEEKENVIERRRRYTTRGTTVLTRTSDNREIKRKSRITVAIRKFARDVAEGMYV